LIGIAIVTILTAYGGVGVNLLLAVYHNEVPRESVALYTIVVLYFLGVAFLLLMAAVFTLAEFSNWTIKHHRVLGHTTFSLLLALAIVHTVAFFSSVSDQEVKKLFVDESMPYALLTFVLVGLFLILRRLARS
jgi:hypothetical protein